MRLFFLVLALLVGNAFATEPMRYIFPPPESDNDHRYDYYWELLHTALESNKDVYGAYELSPHSVRMNAARSVAMLKNNEGITLLLRVTSNDLESTFRPIRIPLDKGLTGYRLFLIKTATQEKLNAVKTFNDLKPFSFGAGAKWADVEILRTAGLTVVPGETYDGLFRMLQLERFDVFSRGVNEIAVELSENKPKLPDLAIEQNLMLYFPLPRYFFVAPTPEGEKLAHRIEDGLRRLMKSGEFEKRYQAFKQKSLTGINLAGRRVFRIKNPTLPTDTPLSQTELWDNLSRELKTLP